MTTEYAERMPSAWTHAYTETRRGQVVFIVEDEHGDEYAFKSPVAANAAFPGAFDEPDSEQT